MNKLAFRMAQTQAISNPKTKQGLALFERNIGRIEWLHPAEHLRDIKSDKKYAVINAEGEVIFKADKLSDIAKEFCTSISRVSKCMTSNLLLNERYMIVRCENE